MGAGNTLLGNTPLGLDEKSVLLSSVNRPACCNQQQRCAEQVRHLVATSTVVDRTVRTLRRQTQSGLQPS